MRNMQAFCGLLLLAIATFAWAQDGGEGRTMRARLSGANETPANLSNGTGTVTVRVTESPASIEVAIKYSGLTGNPTMAHLHLGNRWEPAGPPVVTICAAPARPCPAQGVEQTFTFPLTGNAITAVPAQGFAADVATLLRAMRSGIIYANVHTPAFPAGEIRGQLSHGRSDQDNPGRGQGNRKIKDKK